MPGVFGVNLYARFTEYSDGSGGIAQIVLNYDGRHPVETKIRDMLGKPTDNQVYQSARQLLREHVQAEEFGRIFPFVIVSDKMLSSEYGNLIARLKQINGLKIYDGTSIGDNAMGGVDDVIDGTIARITRLGNSHSHAQK